MIDSISVKPTDLFSRFEPSGRAGRFFNFPLARILVVVAFFVPVAVINALVISRVIEKVPEPLATQIDVVRMSLTFVLIVVTYKLYCNLFEKRPALEIGFHGFAKESGLGALLGAAAVTFTVVVLYLAGAYSIQALNSTWILPKSLVLFSVGALFQDLMLLCVLFRLLEEVTGTWIAIFVSLLAFSMAHLGNPEATVGSVSALFLSGILLVAPFILTRRIWLSWGLHASWNFMQSGVFGMPNSGYQFPGWIEPVIDGPTWLTGGAIGIEASYLAVSLDVVLGVGLLILAVRRGQLLAPRWKRGIPAQPAE
jgi:membrane protease YdiL (CAAX protease family)